MKRVIVICCVLMCFGGVQLVQSPIIEGHFEFIEGKGRGESCNR